VAAGIANRKEQPRTHVVDDLSANLNSGPAATAAPSRAAPETVEASRPAAAADEGEGRDPITILERIRLANRMRNGGASTLPLGIPGNAFIDASDFGGR
jgi:hypothetical protein